MQIVVKIVLCCCSAKHWSIHTTQTYNV